MATIDRPFRVLFDTAGDTERLEITIDFRSPIDDDARLTVSEVMTAFAKLGASGALAGHRYDPGQSITVLEDSEMVPHHRGIAPHEHAGAAQGRCGEVP